MATRAGTNKFSGTAYEFLRNRELNSNTFFNNRGGVARPPFVQNQYGVEANGPILKDKLFFMGNWEGYRQRVGKPLVLSVPTTAMRSGDFSNLRGANGALIPIYDPYTVCGSLGNAACAKDASGNDIVVRQPFPGNMIPTSRLNPARWLTRRSWGLPNTTGRAVHQPEQLTSPIPAPAPMPTGLRFAPTSTSAPSSASSAAIRCGNR